MTYTAYKNGEKRGSSYDFTSLIISVGLVNDETLKELFNEKYGAINTPVGEVPMGELMIKYLDANDWYLFVKEIANEFIFYMEAESGWEISGPWQETLSYEEWTFVCSSEENEREECLKRNLERFFTEEDVVKTCNRMEGEW